MDMIRLKWLTQKSSEKFHNLYCANNKYSVKYYSFKEKFHVAVSRTDSALTIIADPGISNRQHEILSAGKPKHMRK